MMLKGAHTEVPPPQTHRLCPFFGLARRWWRCSSKPSSIFISHSVQASGLEVEVQVPSTDYFKRTLCFEETHSQSTQRLCRISTHGRKHTSPWATDGHMHADTLHGPLLLMVQNKTRESRFTIPLVLRCFPLYDKTWFFFVFFCFAPSCDTSSSLYGSSAMGAGAPERSSVGCQLNSWLQKTAVISSCRVQLCVCVQFCLFSSMCVPLPANQNPNLEKKRIAKKREVNLQTVSFILSSLFLCLSHCAWQAWPASVWLPVSCPYINAGWRQEDGAEKICIPTPPHWTPLLKPLAVAFHRVKSENWQRARGWSGLQEKEKDLRKCIRIKKNAFLEVTAFV